MTFGIVTGTKGALSPPHALSQHGALPLLVNMASAALTPLALRSMPFFSRLAPLSPRKKKLNLYFAILASFISNSHEEEKAQPHSL